MVKLQLCWGFRKYGVFIAIALSPPWPGMIVTDKVLLLYSHMPYHNNTTIIKQTHDYKVAGINDAHRKTQEDFFYKIFYLSLYL